jgi:hypothetical protein
MSWAPSQVVSLIGLPCPLCPYPAVSERRVRPGKAYVALPTLDRRLLEEDPFERLACQ